jgi:hypothetical protein
VIVHYQLMFIQGALVELAGQARLMARAWKPVANSNQSNTEAS